MNKENPETTHIQVRELLAAKALDALNAEELGIVEGHLSTCERCRRELGEYCDAAVQVADISTRQPLAPLQLEKVRARLVARAAADLGNFDEKALIGPTNVLDFARRKTPGSWTHWSGWAVAAGLSSLLLSHHAFHRPLDLGWLAAAGLSVVAVLLGGYIVSQRKALKELRDNARRRGVDARHAAPALRERSRGSSPG